MEANVRTLERRAPGSPALARFAETARILTGEPTATVDDGLAWLHALCADLAVPSLSRFGLSGRDLPQAATQAMKASSMSGNPIELNEQELTDILHRAF
jgi:alcohol dehydrogenase class IV